jgi:hypothetical protein
MKRLSLQDQGTGLRAKYPTRVPIPTRTILSGIEANWGTIAPAPNPDGVRAKRVRVSVKDSQRIANSLLIIKHFFSAQIPRAIRVTRLVLKHR